MNSGFWEQVNFEGIEWLEEIHQKFLKNEDLDPSLKYFFEGYFLGLISNQKERKEITSEEKKNIYVDLVVKAYQDFGYLSAEVSPLLNKKSGPILFALILGYSKHFDKGELFSYPDLFQDKKVSFETLIERLEKLYCSSIGLEIKNCSEEIKKFIFSEVNKNSLYSEKEKLQILTNLSKAVFFEDFLQVKFTGKKRFSLEGAESLIPMLETMIELATEENINSFVIGMSHRGRLNVLTNVLNKPYSQIFLEFEDKPFSRGLDSVGDVKYHAGYVSKRKINDNEIDLVIPPNSGHLESINPIVEGITLAKQEKLGNKGVVPILIHGDAAFSGQGVVYETLQLSKIKGYSCSGSLHIVIDNELGFTTSSKESRSTLHCSDIGKIFGTPIFHVNSEKPEDCCRVITWALKVRQKFSCDVIINLCCYRRYGHNEGDDPSFTQPVEYSLIKRKNTPLSLYKEDIINEFPLQEDKIKLIEEKISNDIREEHSLLKKEIKIEKTDCLYCPTLDEKMVFSSIDTKLDLFLLKNLGEKLISYPKEFNPYSKLKSLLEKRNQMIEGSIKCNWGMAENLAIASLLVEGFNVRFSGQDSIRGTFNQRHLVWYDCTSGEPYSPFYHLAKGQGKPYFYNSPLSEYAVLGFEFGYSVENPKDLVIWEAQFGDFANGAQIIFDQYISSSVQKWDLHSNLVVLLPHGYEGQGPEHSSSRIERHLQLAANYNFSIVCPSSPVQYFHLLRSHMKQDCPIPLIVFSPKGLLRSPLCLSHIEELAQGKFYEFLEEENPSLAAKVMVFCTGKVYYDLLNYINKLNKEKDIAVIRIEQLYPFKYEIFMDLLKKYTNISSYVWLQEEPSNMGAYEYIYFVLKNYLPKNLSLNYVGRPHSGSTATGSHDIHLREVEQFMENLFTYL